VSAIYGLFLAFTMYPDVQRRAQEEVDRVIGAERLPGLADRDKLEYIDAVVKEVHRWNIVGPIGMQIHT
jgi:cytochrome P450